MNEIAAVNEHNSIPWAGVVLLLLATLYVLFGSALVPAASNVSASFELQATDIHGQMHIHWNSRAFDVTQAESAVFEVKDGEALYQFPVSARVLATGAIEYLRTSDDVAATLILFKDGKELGRRTVRSVSLKSFLPRLFPQHLVEC